MLEPDELDASGRAVVAGARAEHVRRVLGLEPGATLRAGIVGGAQGTARIEGFGGGGEVALDCREIRQNGELPPRQAVDLLLALPRPKVLKRLLAPLACLGVGRVLLTNAARVERYYFDSHVLAPSFVRERLLEGLSQARDTRLPEVSVHRSFRKLVEDELDELAAGSRRLLTDLAARDTASIRETLAPHEGGEGAQRPKSEAMKRGGGTEPRSRERVLLAVGPEGGWVDFERSLLSERGFRTVTLGSRILRSDVACVVALALAHEALDHRTSRT